MWLLSLSFTIALQTGQTDSCDVAFSCQAQSEVAPGCSDVSGGLEVGLQMDLDPDRELQRIHSLFITHMERLERLRCNYTQHTHASE
jgi:hypothetical protein